MVVLTTRVIPALSRVSPRRPHAVPASSPSSRAGHPCAPPPRAARRHMSWGVLVPDVAVDILRSAPSSPPPRPVASVPSRPLTSRRILPVVSRGHGVCSPPPPSPAAVGPAAA